MNDTIEVTVRVPGDLTIKRDSTRPGWVMVIDGDNNGVSSFSETRLWYNDVLQQIAAAIEARRPKPPKFQVGDVVEWRDGDTELAGVITSERNAVEGRYYVNLRHTISEDRLTLVRRAAK